MYTLALRTRSTPAYGVLGKLNLTRNILCIFPRVLLLLLLLLSGCLRKMQFMCFAACELRVKFMTFPRPSKALRRGVLGFWFASSGVCVCAPLPPAPSYTCSLLLLSYLPLVRGVTLSAHRTHVTKSEPKRASLLHHNTPSSSTLPYHRPQRA